MDDRLKQAAADYQRRRNEATKGLPPEEQTRREQAEAARRDAEVRKQQAAAGIARITKVADSFAAETKGLLPDLMTVGYSDEIRIYGLASPAGGYSGSETLQFTWDPTSVVTAYMSPKTPIPAGLPSPSQTALGSVPPSAASEEWVLSMFIEWINRRTPDV